MNNANHEQLEAMLQRVEALMLKLLPNQAGGTHDGHGSHGGHGASPPARASPPPQTGQSSLLV